MQRCMMAIASAGLCGKPIRMSLLKRDTVTREFFDSCPISSMPPSRTPSLYQGGVYEEVNHHSRSSSRK